MTDHNEENFDIEQFRLSPSSLGDFDTGSNIEGSKAPNPHWIQGEFLRGPIPLSWLSQAAKLPGKAPLAIALALWFESGRKKDREVKLTTPIAERFIGDRRLKSRGLKGLQSAGLIEVTQPKTKNPTVRILV